MNFIVPDILNDPTKTKIEDFYEVFERPIDTTISERYQRRIAYIIDSIKHPAEVNLFRRVFGESFYAVGVVSSDAKRYERLKHRKGFTEQQFKEISELDGNDNTEFGQKATEAVVKSDYFFVNNYDRKDDMLKEIDRFLSLIFQSAIVTPRQDEKGMNVAFKSAALSACLSRQVGAAIFSEDGNILATGQNDVPRFGGGLYTSESEHDQRCWTRGAKCYNDEEKSKISREIVDELSAVLQTHDAFREEIITEFAQRLTNSRVSKLIEFSRSIHAEMEALLAVARNGTRGLQNSTLYSTTYPCHSCAKHIIGSGIRRVVYLEPYEKSLAKELHGDAIQDPLAERGDDKVSIELFGGVAPRKYDSFFKTDASRKYEGKYIDKDSIRRGLSPVAFQDIDVLHTRIRKLLEPHRRGENDHEGVTK